MPLPKKIVMASGNAGKIREIARLLADLDVEIVPQSDFDVPDADETGTSFVENSVIKARHAAALTGLPAIADDSGLSVDALDGRPGVYSARYAGPAASDDDNVDKLLAEMHGVTDRGAAFHCVASFVADADAEPLLGEGEWRGEILTGRRGVNGFGYGLRAIFRRVAKAIFKISDHRNGDGAGDIPAMVDRLLHGHAVILAAF